MIAARREPTIPQNSPVGESQANGLVERAVRSVKDQVRTLRLALQKRVGCRIPVGHPIMTWMVKHAGELISKYQLNRDGKTAYYKVFGKPCKDVIVEIGEEVHYRVSEVDTGSLDSRWESGIWLGTRWRSMEHHIGTPDGVLQSYRIERKPLEDRWSKEAVEAIVGTPWRPQPSLGDTTAPRVLPPLPADQQLRNQPRPKEPEVRAPLRPRISQHDLTRWGFTDGCLRFRQMRLGEADAGTKHSEQLQAAHRDRYEERVRSKDQTSRR